MLSDGSAQVPVTIKFTSPGQGISHVLAAVANELVGMETKHLLVVNRPVPDLAKAMRLEDRLLVVVWNGGSDDDNLEVALANIFSTGKRTRPRAR